MLKTIKKMRILMVVLVLGITLAYAAPSKYCQACGVPNGCENSTAISGFPDCITVVNEFNQVSCQMYGNYGDCFTNN